MARRLRLSSFLLFGLLLAGCSGAADDTNAAGSPTGAGGQGAGGASAGGGAGGSGSPGAAGAGSGVDWGNAAEPVGSFDVRLLDVSTVNNIGPRLDHSPSQGALLRIDFPSDCGGASGVESDRDPTPCVLRPDFKGKVLVTVQGGVSAAYDVLREDGALILFTDANRVYVEGAVAAGATGAGGGGDAYFVSDRWSKFTFLLDARGQVVPPVLAQAGQTFTVGDSPPSFPIGLNGRASFHADRTAPKAELVVGSPFSPPGVQLPWDPIAVRFDEPVLIEPREIIVATPVGQAQPAALVWRWATGEVPLPQPLIGAFGATWYRGYWPAWDPSPSDSAVRIGAFKDSRGNFGEGFERALKVVSPPANPAPGHDFNLAADDAKLVLWGGASIAAQGCEPDSGRCLGFTFDNVECGLAETAGVALRLQAPAGGGSELELKARVRVELLDGEGGGLDPLSVQILWAGAEAPQIEALEAGETRRWGTVAVSIGAPIAPAPPATPPANPDDIAVVFRSGGKYATEACRKGAPTPRTTRVTVDSIAIEPIPARLGAR